MRQFMEASDCCGAGIVSWGLCCVFQVVPPFCYVGDAVEFQCPGVREHKIQIKARTRGFSEHFIVSLP